MHHSSSASDPWTQIAACPPSALTRFRLASTLDPLARVGEGVGALVTKSHAMAPTLRFARTWTRHHTVSLYSLFVDGSTSVSLWCRPTASVTGHILCGPLLSHRITNIVTPLNKLNEG